MEKENENLRRLKGNPLTRFEVTVGKVFIIAMLLLLVFNFLSPTRVFSEREYRSLAQRPVFSPANIRSGEYARQLELFLRDQFFARDMWRGIRVSSRMFAGSRMENGVFIGSGGQLLEDIVIPDLSVLEETIAAIRAYSLRYPEISMYMMLVPDGAAILTGRLPVLANVADQGRLIQSVRGELESDLIWLDAMRVLRIHQDQGVFYRTDPHWTSLGAFRVFEEVAPELGIEEDVAARFASFPISNSFNGELALRTGRRTRITEEITIFAPQGMDNDVIVNFVDEQRRTTSLYDRRMLDTRNQHRVFLSGSASIVTINTLSPSQRRLLIIRDSSANSFVPFLTPYFREIILVDPQYYAGTIDEIMEMYRVTDVFFLYRGNQFFQDTHLRRALNDIDRIENILEGSNDVEKTIEVESSNQVESYNREENDSEENFRDPESYNELE